MRALKLIPAVLAVSLLAAPAFARQDDARDGKTPAAAHAKSKANAKQREAKRVAAMKKAGIDAARVKQVVEVQKRYQHERQPVVREMREHQRAMRELEKSQRTNDPAYAREKEAIQTQREKLRTIGERQKAEIAKILTPAEQAKVKKQLHRGKTRHDRDAKKGKTA